MTSTEKMLFEFCIMTLAQAEQCKTLKEFEQFAKEIHASVDNAIHDLAMFTGIKVYSHQPVKNKDN